MTVSHRILRRIAFAVLLIQVALQSSVIAQSVLAKAPTDEVRRERIALGIEHLEIKRARGVENERWLINVLDVDPGAVRLEVALAMDEIVGAETTSSLAARHGAIAAINGGYFRTTGIVRGEPAGVFVRHGQVLSEAIRNRAGLAIGNNRSGLRVAITHISTTARVNAGGISRKIDGVNRPGDDGELILYTPDFHRTTLTSPGRMEITVSNQRVSSIETSGSQRIPDNGYVLSATGEASVWLRAHLRKGRRVNVELTASGEPHPQFDVAYFIGGGPQLVSNASAVMEVEFESFSASLIKSRHPRTAVGIRRDGHILFVTVDGRQPSVSVGMTISELTSLMLELNSTHALNLDGGGSTTMVIRDKIVNRPSDQNGERAVSDALLLFALPQKNQ